MNNSTDHEALMKRASVAREFARRSLADLAEITREIEAQGYSIQAKKIPYFKPAWHGVVRLATWRKGKWHTVSSRGSPIMYATCEAALASATYWATEQHRRAARPLPISIDWATGTQIENDNVVQFKRGGLVR